MKQTLGMLAFALLLLGCAKQPRAEVEPHAESAAEHNEVIRLSPEALKLADVRTGVVAVHTIQSNLELPGTVSIPSDARAIVTPPVAGKVVRLFVGPGDRVTKGQPLAEIQSGDLASAASAVSAAETEALQARARVSQMGVALKLAKDRLRTASTNQERQRRFAQTGAFSQPALQAATAELNEAQSELLSAQAEEASHIAQLDRAERLFKEGLISTNDLETARLERRQDEVRLTRARSRIDLAKRAYEREQRIGKEGLANARELGTAEAEVRAAKLSVDQARIDLLGARGALAGAQRAQQSVQRTANAIRGGSGQGSNIVLTAPIAGTITERQATLGQAVERASDLFEVENNAVVWVTVMLPEANLSAAKKGASVRVATDAYPGKTFPGTVQLIGSRLDPKSRTLPVQCRVNNAQGQLRADLFTRVHLATNARLSVLAVPLSAVTGEGEEAAVFVEEGNTFTRRTVKTGRSDGNQIEIIKGLRAGERIAVSGVFILVSELKKAELKGHED